MNAKYDESSWRQPYVVITARIKNKSKDFYINIANVSEMNPTVLIKLVLNK